MSEEIKPGSIITVRDWPGVEERDRFKVRRVYEVPASEYKIQVDATPVGNHGLGMRTFPLELCTLSKRGGGEVRSLEELGQGGGV